MREKEHHRINYGRSQSYVRFIFPNNILFISSFARLNARKSMHEITKSEKYLGQTYEV